MNVKSAKHLWNQIILVLEKTLPTTFGYKETTEPITIKSALTNLSCYGQMISHMHGGSLFVSDNFFPITYEARPVSPNFHILCSPCNLRRSKYKDRDRGCEWVQKQYSLKKTISVELNCITPPSLFLPPALSMSLFSSWEPHFLYYFYIYMHMYMMYMYIGLHQTTYKGTISGEKATFSSPSSHITIKGGVKIHSYWHAKWGTHVRIDFAVFRKS